MKRNIMMSSCLMLLLSIPSPALADDEVEIFLPGSKGGAQFEVIQKSFESKAGGGKIIAPIVRGKPPTLAKQPSGSGSVGQAARSVDLKSAASSNAPSGDGSVSAAGVGPGQGKRKAGARPVTKSNAVQEFKSKAATPRIGE